MLPLFLFLFKWLLPTIVDAYSSMVWTAVLRNYIRLILSYAQFGVCVLGILIATSVSNFVPFRGFGLIIFLHV